MNTNKAESGGDSKVTSGTFSFRVNHGTYISKDKSKSVKKLHRNFAVSLGMIADLYSKPVCIAFCGKMS